MNRRALIISLAAAIALLALWFVLLWSPQGKDLSAADDRTETAEAENGTLELRLARLRAAQEQAPALTAAVDELRRAIPDDPGLAQFILDANDAASAAGVDFLSISPSPPAPPEGGGPPIVRLAISVTGTYFSLLDYLDRVEQLPRLVVVDTVALNPGADEGGTMSLAISGHMFTTGVTPVAATPTTTTVPPPASGEQVTTSTQTAPEITVTANG